MWHSHKNPKITSCLQKNVVILLGKDLELWINYYQLPKKWEMKHFSFNSSLHLDSKSVWTGFAKGRKMHLFQMDNHFKPMSSLCGLQFERTAELWQQHYLLQLALTVLIKQMTCSNIKFSKDTMLMICMFYMKMYVFLLKIYSPKMRTAALVSP